MTSAIAASLQSWSAPMKSILLIEQLVFGVGWFLATILPVYPHGGGLNCYGCLTTVRRVVITATADRLLEGCASSLRPKAAIMF